ncbi:bifunctional 3-oxoadipate enol-lactonase/4-carboxymuconolactone decarboxylase PcaDC [Kocuria rhizosphaericola]|uniref:bifunctional 3-oxoadipate enol-lactonase/4-carboxymuconolactone decarboxylase PcaDC n=1 Tax=Kocuria rhizosphaericola TaxID=3376284 RepID=UPI003F88538F
MTVPVLTLVEFSTRRAPSPQAPLVVLGPGLGTSAASLWGAAAHRLEGDLRVVGWDLPGHGGSAPAGEPFSTAELARAVLEAVDRCRTADGVETGGPFSYAGTSLGGCVGVQLLLDAPHRLRSAVLVGTAVQVGEPAAWAERAQLVAAAGTPTQVVGSAQRWFAPGFIERDAVTTTELLHDLQDADRFSYARACEALAAFDARGRLGTVDVPVLAVVGAHDVVTPPDAVAELAGATGARLAVVEDAGHLVPAEAPQDVARLLDEHFCAHPSHDPPRSTSMSSNPRRTEQEAHADGTAVRREVLSDAHVDRAEAGKDAFTAEFQDFISRYAWGEIWTRPGLDRRMRSAVTLTALIAAGHWEEFEMHVRAALRNGLERDEIKEILLQSAIYLSVPSANNAFKHAKQVLDALDAEGARDTRPPAS